MRHEIQFRTALTARLSLNQKGRCLGGCFTEDDQALDRCWTPVYQGVTEGKVLEKPQDTLGVNWRQHTWAPTRNVKEGSGGRDRDN
jgi:hypothetical protein